MDDKQRYAKWEIETEQQQRRTVGKRQRLTYTLQFLLTLSVFSMNAFDITNLNLRSNKLFNLTYCIVIHCFEIALFQKI